MAIIVQFRIPDDGKVESWIQEEQKVGETELVVLHQDVHNLFSVPQVELRLVKPIVIGEHVLFHGFRFIPFFTRVLEDKESK